MLDLSPIANAVKSVQPLPPQAQPSVVEEMKPVPETEIQSPVAPPPKGGEPGLGEHLDLYDNQAAQAPPTKEAKATQVIPDDAPIPSVQAEIARAKEAEAKKEKLKAKVELLGKDTGLPQPTTDPAHPDLPFLKPLGKQPLGASIDARI
jgi:hypothetical protein